MSILWQKICEGGSNSKCSWGSIEVQKKKRFEEKDEFLREP